MRSGASSVSAITASNSGFEPASRPKPNSRAVSIDFLDDEPLLIHLDGEDGAVSVLVVVLSNCLLEGLVQADEAVSQDVGETDDDWRGQVTCLESFDDLEQIDLVLGRTVRPHDHMSRIVDAEVGFTPRRHLIQIERIVDLPVAIRRELLGGVIHGFSGASRRSRRER